MPNLDKIAPPSAPKPVMKNRMLRAPDDLWEAAQARAAADGITLSQVIRHYLRAYVGQDES